MSKLHLASASPRRRELLAAIGLDFSWAATDIDETPVTGEAASEMVLRLAEEKARAGQRSFAAVLAADTAVVLGEQILGKPCSLKEALDMLARLSAQTHRVMTGVALLVDGKLSTALSVSSVTFRPISPAEAAAYCRCGEYEGKAGAYAIQGLGGTFVESLTGSYSGVVGLPVFGTAGLLRRAGMDILAITTIGGHDQ